MNRIRLFAISLLLVFSLPSSAGVVDTPDVSFGGQTYRTFQDDTTSLYWLDLDNFFDETSTYNSLIALLDGSGFHLATFRELTTLQASIPAIPENFATEVVITGGNDTSRQTMWGIYEDGNPTDGVSYAYKYDNTPWVSDFNVIAADLIFSTVNSVYKDLGAWIVEGEVHSVGGTVSGLTGTGLELQNNGGDTLAVAAAATAFTFATELPDLATYAVTVSTQPTGQTCSVASGSGTLAGVDITDVTVSCSTNVTTNNELRNIATRADVGIGNDIAIAGFIITGSGQKCVIVRGRGPSVGVPAGVTRLPDPTLTLKSGSGTTTIAENDNWAQQDNPDHVAIIEGLGKAPGDLLDAAIYICLDPGAYTVLVRGHSGTTGVGMAEVLDVDNASPYLRNIATRAKVGTGHLVTIAGFIISGNTPKQILIRGRGPSVGVPAGVTRLADPILTLKSGQTTIGSNDNWQDAENAADIIATGRAPGDPLDSAIMMVLQPGAYTAILRGVGGTTGVGIVEVLDLTGRQ